MVPIQYGIFVKAMYNVWTDGNFSYAKFYKALGMDPNEDKLGLHGMRNAPDDTIRMLEQLAGPHGKTIFKMLLIRRKINDDLRRDK